MLRVSRYGRRLFQPLVDPCRRAFTVLAFESSADDTCAAVVTSDRKILSNVVQRQSAELAQYGGIYPYAAIRSHQANLPSVVQRALKEANVRIQDIDGIAFTRGPGIGGCLSVTSNAAKTLAAALNKPLVGVHHMQAHALTPTLTLPPEEAPEFPFLSLLISGGHTMLVLVRSPRGYEMLANCEDAPIGNVYDKVARLLGIPPHPAGLGLGAALEKFCEDNPIKEYLPEGGSERLAREELFKQEGLVFTLAMKRKLQFSYSGLHSAVMNYAKSKTEDGAIAAEALSHRQKVLLAHAFQQAAADQLSEKIILVFDHLRTKGENVKHLAISGGVASNKFIRRELEWTLVSSQCRTLDGDNVKLCYPPISLCTDNAAMIGWASMTRFLEEDTDPYDIELHSQWPIDYNSKKS